eukprot:PhM_4_TR8197/c1_g1_i1/m.82020/K08857/NEK1_4_5; NIMA (never in mitosis gene a)-related kinase 1/4/5
MSNFWNEIKVTSRESANAPGAPSPTSTKPTAAAAATPQQQQQQQAPAPQQKSSAAAPIVNPDEALLPEYLRSRYHVERKVGKGAFGVALVVVEKGGNNNEKYVAKVMNLAQMSEKDKQHVKSEIDCLAQCCHGNIIQHKESSTQGNSLVLVTEFADGGDLAKEISVRKKRNMFFQTHEIACVFVQICLAIDHVHSRGILHRDVKPANIFFTKRGLVKLGDFGFSKHYEETLSNPVGNTLCGTPYYLPPEMWLGDRYSKKADVWSLGIVLYEMMSLQRPFTADNMKQLSDNVRRGHVDPIPSNQYDPELVAGCMSLLTQDPQQRPDIKDILKLRVCQKALKSIRDLLSHSSFANVRATLSSHIDSFLVPGS